MIGPRLTGLALLLATLASICSSAEESESQELDCIIEPSKVLKLGSPVQGILDSVPVDRGDIVEKGQVVARLESSIEQSNVDIAQLRANNDIALRSSRARVSYQQKQAKRFEDLYRQSTASQENFDKVTTERALAELALEESELERRQAKLELLRAQAILERRIIRSPIDGVITERALYSGEYVNEQSYIVTVAEIDPLHVEVYVPSELYGQVRQGTKATILQTQPRGDTYTAAATIVDSVIDSASGTFGVRVELPNPEGSIPAGSRCRIRFEL